MLNPLLEKIKASRQKAKLLTLYQGRAATLKLRQYQKDDIEWLKQRGRGVLAWAPGLGKTLGASEAAVLPAIVSVPLSLVEQWREHLEREYPTDRVVVAAYGDMIQRDAALHQPYDWLIINHDMWRTYAMPRNAETLIVDEFHHFRNREAARSKQLAVYSKLIPRVYGLTATPVYKDVSDLFWQLHILDHAKFTSYWDFINKFAVVDSGRWGTSVIKTRNERALKALVSEYMHEMTYKQAGMFLPDRIDKHVVLKMDPKYRKNVYDELRIHYRMEIDNDLKRFENAGAVLHMLRKVTLTDEKLKAVKEIVADVPPDKPVGIFVWYKEAAKQVAEALDGVEITGKDDPAERRMLARTGGPEKKRVRVATMASLSEGVDLSEMRTVIFVEEDYTPGRNYQAMTRVQRARVEANSLGADPVLAYWVRYENTVDQVVHETARARTIGSAMSVLKEALA